MAHVRFNGYREFVSDEVLSVEEERWGLHGPAHTRWVEKHVYWVLPVGTLFLVALLFLVFFWGFGGSFRAARGTAFTQRTGQGWIPVQPVQPIPSPAVSTPPPPTQVPATPPQVTVNVPDRIQVNATVRNVTAPPSAPAPSRELTPEEKANQFWDRRLNREP
ncbi:MAG: hypothetical protein HYT67_01425 [Candidatus Yanofskybacteria bacterium]|nr:hypothetical protein [Candidatus Yanofskybacteria bacterium]